MTTNIEASISTKIKFCLEEEVRKFIDNYYYSDSPQLISAELYDGKNILARCRMKDKRKSCASLTTDEEDIVSNLDGVITYKIPIGCLLFQIYENGAFRIRNKDVTCKVVESKTKTAA